MEMLLELILIGSVIVGVGFLVDHIVNDKFGTSEETKPTPEPVVEQKKTKPKKKTTKKKAIRKTPTKPKSKQTK